CDFESGEDRDGVVLFLRAKVALERDSRPIYWKGTGRQETKPGKGAYGIPFDCRFIVVPQNGCETPGNSDRGLLGVSGRGPVLRQITERRRYVPRCKSCAVRQSGLGLLFATFPHSYVWGYSDAAPARLNRCLQSQSQN